MYQKGDYIVYATCGVCRVEGVGTPGCSRPGENRPYYTLAPVYGTETIFVPVDTPAFMRPVMTREEAEALIALIPQVREEPADTRNLQMLSEQYQAALQSHESEALVHLIKAIYAKSQSAEKAGRKPSVIDQRYKKRAEDLLHGELAVALGIPRDDVPGYISSRIEAAPDAPHGAQAP